MVVEEIQRLKATLLLSKTTQVELSLTFKERKKILAKLLKVIEQLVTTD